MATVRGAAIYWNGRRLGRITEGNFTEPDGGENLVCEDGMLGRSKGVTVSTISVTSIIEVAGNSITDIRKGEVGDLTISPFGGKVMTAKMTCTQSTGTWNHASGMCTGQWEFTGPEFKLQG